MQDLPCQPILHELDHGVMNIGSLKITSDYVCHPGPTVAYRIETDKAVFAYIPDHEPWLGSVNFPNEASWTSGYNIAENADLLFHDSQYRHSEYINRIGWGHSSFEDALQFATLTKVRKAMLFHHDPMHNDEQLNALFEEAIKDKVLPFEVGMCKEGATFNLDE